MGHGRMSEADASTKAKIKDAIIETMVRAHGECHRSLVIRDVALRLGAPVSNELTELVCAIFDRMVDSPKGVRGLKFTYRFGALSHRWCASIPHEMYPAVRAAKAIPSTEHKRREALIFA